MNTDDEIRTSLTLPEGEFIAEPRFPEASSASAFNLMPFIAELNHILKKLPKPGHEAWAHSFKLQSDVLVTVKFNDKGFTAPANIIITNLDPNKTYEFGLKEIKHIGTWLQERCFGKDPDISPGTPASECWNVIMGDNDMPAPIFYTNSSVTVDGVVNRDFTRGVTYSRPRTDPFLGNKGLRAQSGLPSTTEQLEASLTQSSSPKLPGNQ